MAAAVRRRSFGRGVATFAFDSESLLVAYYN
jgi:hypothetical protein